MQKTQKSFFWIIYSQSAVAFSTLRGIFPLPCYNTMHSITRANIIETECSLLDVKFIASFTNQFIRRYTQGTIAATLAIDAIVVAPKDIDSLKSEFRSSSPKLLKAFNTQINFSEEVKAISVNDAFENECRTADSQKSDEQSSLQTKEEVSSQPTDFKKQIIIPKTELLNNVFIFYIEPLNPNVPCLPVHMWLQHGGSANEVVRKLTEHVIMQVDKSEACIIKQISTDGDLGHQPEYTEAMKTLLKISNNLDIDIICDALRACPSIKLAVADMLHCLKTLRIKILLHVLSLFPYRLTTIFDIRSLSDIFGDGKEITDLSHIGKMRDAYPIRFFSLKNLLNLKRKRVWSGVLLFMPWSMWTSAVLNTAFTSNARLIMLTICYEMIKRFYNIILTNEEWNPLVGEVARSSKQFITFVSQSVLERLIPTLAAYISTLRNFIEIKEMYDNVDARFKEAEKETKEELKEVLVREGSKIRARAAEIGEMFGFPDDIELDLSFKDLGTYALENFNGNIRDTAHNNDTVTSTPHIVARAHTQKVLKRELNIKNAKRSRLNIGGIKLSQSKNLCDINDIDPVTITESLFLLSDAASKETIIKGSFDNEMVQRFFNFLDEAAAITEKYGCLPDLTVPNSTRNASIDNRIFGYA